MKISRNWLNEFIELNLSNADLEQVLTNCGLEVEHYETYESVQGGLKGLVTGEVLTCVQHPNADRLRVTTVDAGTGTPLHIVCGAPNVAAGQKVVVALVGTTLYPSTGEPFKIAKSKIRGEVSEGMLCAEDEIGLGQSHAGIMVLPAETKTGIPVSEILSVYTDTVFEIGLTPNRGDAASHLGVARDIHAVKNLPLKTRTTTLPAKTTDKKVEVVIEDTDACPRYTGLVLSGVKVQPSPDWLQNKLKAIGLTPINNIVDATNYVLHSIGQPIHAFDVSKIKGNKIIVKKANNGDKFTTLDKTERKLQGVELMICNAEAPMAIAGVFGGLDSGISETTTDVFIESACFNPAAIRKSAKTHGLSTDASFRFERGTDPNITVDAAILTANLIMELAGGNIASDLVDIYPHKIASHQVNFNLSRFYKLAGKEISANEIKAILNRLEITIKQESEDQWLLTVPAYRVDVTRDVDIAEEIMRIYGYNNIDIPASIRSCISVTEEEKKFQFRTRMGDFLSHSAFNEMYGFSLTSSSNYTEEEKKTLVSILNPLSNELDVLRQSMLFYGLQTIQYNRNRRQPDLKLYEFGKTYHKTDKGYEEKSHLALWVTGHIQEPNWNTPAKEVSYYYLKTFVFALLDKTGGANAVETIYADARHLHHRSELRLNGEFLGEFGAVNTALSKKYDIDAPVFYANLNWDLMCRLALENKLTVLPVAKFPEVRRDLSMLIDKQVKFADLERIARETERKLLRKVDVFDVYEGNKLPEGKKSYALSFILQDNEKTLTSEQVEKVMQKFVDNYRKQLNAEIRQ